MIITEDSDLGRITIVKDNEGRKVHYIKSFDTETKEAEVYAFIRSGFTSKIAVHSKEIVTFKCTLFGCRAFNKKTGEEIK